MLSSTRSVTIEEDMAKEMLETCFMNMEHPDQNTGLIINMSRVAFVSEAAKPAIRRRLY